MITISTHDGQFHADEVTACMILRTLYPKSKLIRTRDQKIIDESSFAIDVGRIYDSQKNRFDHHQEDCSEFFDNESKWIPLSSAGLVYKKYGAQFIKQFCKFEYDDDLDEVYKKFYYAFIQEIDAIDNGVKQSEGELKYWVCTGISTIINRLNNESVYNEEEQMQRFIDGMDYVLMSAKIIIRSIYQRHLSFKDDYNTVINAFDTRFDIDSSLQILLLKNKCNNWQKCVMEYEKKEGGFDETNNIKFVIYRSSREWRVRAVTTGYQSRKYLLSKEKLEKCLSNPSDLIFVHSNLFLASAKSYDTAVEIAKKSLGSDEIDDGDDLIFCKNNI